MKKILKFFLEIGKLKRIIRKGLTFYGVKTSHPDSSSDHCFRLALMAWILGKEKNINIERVIKMSLIHDMSKVFAGDITPYDEILPKNKKLWPKIANRWRRIILKKKEKIFYKKFKKEKKALEKLLSFLPSSIKNEILSLWLDYREGKSKEAKFVSQLDVLENLLESVEWRRETRKFPVAPWWEHAEEEISDEKLLEFLKEIGKKVK